MINMIWAMDNDNLIGKDDLIPWHIKEDLIYYKKRTKGQTVIMGDTTYYSLKGYYKDKPLPYGKIYVASVDKSLVIEGCTMVYDLVEFIKSYKDDIWVVGGSTIYSICLPYADSLYISFVKGKHEGNRYFPKIDFSKYNLEWENETELVRYTKFVRK